MKELWKGLSSALKKSLKSKPVFIPDMKSVVDLIIIDGLITRLKESEEIMTKLGFDSDSMRKIGELKDKAEELDNRQ